MTFDIGDRRDFLRFCAAAAAAGGTLPSGAATQLPLARLVVSSPPGSGLDLVSRRLAESLQGTYAAATVVDNRPGASGQIAMQFVKNTPADGSNMIVVPLPYLYLYPYTYKKLPYDASTDFAPVCETVHFELAFAVGPAVPTSVKNMKDFFAWAKANPGHANFGSPAIGGTPHFVGAMAGRAAGVEITHLPYRGPPPAAQDLVAGQISAVCLNVGDIMSFIGPGKARVLATTGLKRNRFVPEVETFVEQGFKDIVVSDMFGLYVPAKTPKEQIDALSAAVKIALDSPKVIKVFEENGLEAQWSKPAVLQDKVESEYRRWGPIVKALNFTANTE